MIYITFDSNIWIYLLDDAWKEENPLDYLEHWIEEGLLTIVLPEVILEEWDRHRMPRKEERKKKLIEFFIMADEILPSSFIRDQRKPDNIERIIEDQFKRIETIIKSKSKVITCSAATKAKIIEWGLLKKAPLHKKTSVADAMIIFSFFEFAARNPGNDFIFTSANTEDFYEKSGGKKNIHGDLKPEFDQLGIKEYHTLTFMLQELKQRLPITIDLEVLKRNRIKKKASEIAYNPELIESLTTTKDAYLENIKLIDLILKTENPTTQHVVSLFGLTQSNESYKKYFFTNVDKPIWFTILRDRALFSPDQNPEKVNVENGVQIPMWDVLPYLEKISIGISEGKTPELIDELLKIITAVSKQPVDNYRTWAVFLRILKNIPNDKISLDLLSFVGVWLEGKFDDMLVTIGLCEGLLPKFLNDDPTITDINRAGVILDQLFEIHKRGLQEVDSDTGSYYSKVYLHFLKEEFIERQFTKKVAKYCNSEIILKIGKNIKKMLIDYPVGIISIVKDGEKEFEVKVEIKDKNLEMVVRSKGTEAWSETRIIENYDLMKQQELQQSIIDHLQHFDIKYKPQDDFNDIFNQVNHAINTDLHHTFGDNSISELGNRFTHGEKLLEVFALIFRDLIDDKAKVNPEEAKRLIQVICFDRDFGISFFKRIGLYVISQNWELMKNEFFEFVKDKDEELYFSSHRYNKDLYNLLHTNQKALSSEEKNIIKEIIDKGPQGEEKDFVSYWKLRWYSALRDTEPFAEVYLELSELEKISSDHYENLGKIRTRAGNISPITEDEILEMPGKELAKYIRAFKPENKWDGPSIDGLADAIGKAANKNPNKFADEIDEYDQCYYIYIYHILNSLKEAIRKDTIIDREKVLHFCLRYISSPNFYSEKLTIQNDGWKANSDWVVGSIANFITDCTQKVEHELGIEIDPTLKQIVFIMVSNLKPVKMRETVALDYVTYSFNSTAGKSLRALLDYALWRGRNFYSAEEVKWEPEIKELFELTIRKGLIDGYILQGLYYPLFYYLDKGWIVEQVNKHLAEAGPEWYAFVNGLVFSNSSLSKENYDILHPHYEKMLQTTLDKGTMTGLIRDVAAFYFYGYDDLKSDGLMKKIIDTAKPETVSELVAFIWQQEEYYKGLSDEPKVKFEGIIKDLWEYLLLKFENSSKKNEKEILNGIAHFVVFVPQLNAEYGDLLLRSVKLLSRRFLTYHFIEDLVALKNRSGDATTASYLAPALSLLNFSDYISDFETGSIIELVRFLYENGEKESANNFCNKISSTGNLFLKPLYDEFNS